MPLDAVFLGAIANEIREVAIGGKIEKVYQPSRDEIILSIRGKDNCKVLLSANPSHPRAHITFVSRENPEKPPVFCMVLRKHLTGARIMHILQPKNERILDFVLETVNEMGDRVIRHLVFEAMGRNTNIVLVDENNRIIDCIRRLEGEPGVKRSMLPGLFYREPTLPDRVSIEEIEDTKTILPSTNEDIEIQKWILSHIGGISPLICREIAFCAGGTTDARISELTETGYNELAYSLDKLKQTVSLNSYVPVMLKRETEPIDFSFMYILQYGMDVECIKYNSFAELMDDYYLSKENEEKIKNRGADLIKTVKNAITRLEKKTAIQKQELLKTSDREQYRIYGDLITANLYAMRNGMESLSCINYFDENQREVEIPLDITLSPQKNAAKYYKKYNKAKTANVMLAEQIEKGTNELQYLNSVAQSIMVAENEKDLMEIRQELVDIGYMRRQGKASKRTKTVHGKPLEFISSAGLKISVGKNNTQNDYLTTKASFKSDIWFHTQKVHGSHVVLSTNGLEPDDQSIFEAATLAAVYSQGNLGGKLPVDYTKIKYVKRPNGARPGMVIYSVYETIYVEPDESIAKRLKK